jgi:D-alanyl-D-alanine carboxypeptidase
VQRLASVALLLAPLTVTAAILFAFASSTSDAPGGGGGLPVAAASTPPPREKPPVPTIAVDGVDAFHVELRKPPRAGLVYDLRSGEVLWRRDPMRVLPMASLTKIMTALLMVERTRPNDPVRITQAALDYSGSGIGMLPRGRRVKAEGLLNGLMIVSGNDAAIALAVHISGNERRFVALMNKRARAWGLTCTHFASSHGLEPGNRSCARDLAVLARIAMSRPRIRRVVGRTQAVLKFPIKGGKLYLYGHNPLMRLGYAGTIGMKTGYTDEAGRCFVGVVRRGRRTLGVVLLDSRDPAKHAPKLLDAAFAAPG